MSAQLKSQDPQEIFDEYVKFDGYFDGLCRELLALDEGEWLLPDGRYKMLCKAMAAECNIRGILCERIVKEMVAREAMQRCLANGTVRTATAS